MNIQQMMKQAQQMQKKMMERQEELAKQTYEASSGGGMVTAVVNGKHEVLSLKIEKEVVNPEDISMLQDLLIAALNSAHQQVKEAQEAGMGSLLGNMGMKIPGLF